MLIINDSATFAEALDSPIDPALRRLLRVRHDQLIEDTGGDCDIGELAHFIVVTPCDDISDIEAAAGYPIITDPAFEWIADHGGWYEAVTILSDDGFGIALFVPDVEGIDPTLLTLCRSLATDPPSNVDLDD